MKIFKEILLQAGIVCSFICIAAKVLDWYNPFMDFSGHIAVFQVLLYFIILLLTFTGVITKLPHRTIYSGKGIVFKKSGR